MISLVLVSHSRKIAEGLLDLLRQVVAPEVRAAPAVRIAEAAGVGPDFAELGTDPVHIAEVIEAVYSPDGVLVLMDLGSAVLSAEMALELLPEALRPNICICPAPFVEGAIAAGVQAGLGSDLQTVCRESQKALAAKIEQLSPVEATAAQSAENETAPANESLLAAETSQLITTIHNPHGLHLRPAAQFVQTAAQYPAEISVWNQTTRSGPVSGKSINALAMLNVRQGDEIRLSAAGPHAAEVIRALGQLIEQNFGEPVEDEATSQAPAGYTKDYKGLLDGETAPNPRHGTAISAGVAIAPLYHLKRDIPVVEDIQTDDPDTEWQRLEQALQRVKAQIGQREAALRQRSSTAPSADSSAILTAHRLLLEDPELIQAVRGRIFKHRLSAGSAWAAEIKLLKERYQGLPDAYLQQRAADVEGVGRQVLTALAGKTGQIQLPASDPIILYADELTPGETAQLELSQVAGLVTASGGVTDHSAILARALGIPAVSAVRLDDLADGTRLILDGEQGLVWVDPPAEVHSQYTVRQQKSAAEQAARQASSQQPAVLKNGRRIEVLANIGSLAEARQAVAQGAEGVGLLRTEFLFLARTQPPTEEEQVAALRAIAQAMDGRPLTVRTLDAGGDKALPYLALPEEANPFLGLRAIRLTLRHPDLFQAQLRAVLRAADSYPLRLMFPMIATLEDLRQALEQLQKAHADLSAEHIPHGWPIPTGMMVEIPAAALLSEAFAPLVDFFSIGTNDLTQYALAADRTNPALAEYHDALHPAVLRLIWQVIQNGKQHGKPIAICGELAADPLAVPVLVGLGLDELSLNAAAIPKIKEMLRTIDPDASARLAEQALRMVSAATVREAARQYLQSLNL